MGTMKFLTRASAEYPFLRNAKIILYKGGPLIVPKDWTPKEMREAEARLEEYKQTIPTVEKYHGNA